MNPERGRLFGVLSRVPYVLIPYTNPETGRLFGVQVGPAWNQYAPTRYCTYFFPNVGTVPVLPSSPDTIPWHNIPQNLFSLLRPHYQHEGGALPVTEKYC